MSRDPRQGAKKKRTPRQAWQAAERAEKRALAQAARDEREPFASGRGEPAMYGHVDVDQALRDPRNWRYPTRAKGRG